MRKNRQRISQCKNCSEMLNSGDNFCPKCGQENHYHHNTLKELWNDFFGSIFNWEGKIWTTLKSLVFQPGIAAKEYVEGKKKTYANPIRLFLFSAFLLFFVFYNFDFEEEKNKFENEDSFYEIPDSMYQALSSAPNFKFQKVVLDDLSKKEEAKVDINLKNGLIESNYLFEYRNNKNWIDSIELQESGEEHFIKFWIPEYKKKSAVVFVDTLTVTKIEAKELLADEAKLDSLIQLSGGNFINQMAKKFTVHKQLEEFADPVKSSIDLNDKKNGLKNAYSQIFLILIPIIAFGSWLIFRKKQPTFYANVILNFYLNVILIFILIPVYLILQSFDSSGLGFLAICAYIIGVIVYIQKTFRNFYRLGRFSSAIAAIGYSITFAILFALISLILVLIIFLK